MENLLREGSFDDLWIQPAAGDAGGALGAALAVWHAYLDQPKKPSMLPDRQMGSYLGPEFDDDEILIFLNHYSIPFEKYSDKVTKRQDNQVGPWRAMAGDSESVIRPAPKKQSDKEGAVREPPEGNGETTGYDIINKTAKLLANEKVIGWFQGRMEFGPRALGLAAFWVMRGHPKCSGN